MTTASALTTSTRPVTYRSAHVDGRQTLARAVRAEWLKLTSLRSTWITTALAILITAGLGAMIAVTVTDSSAAMTTASWSVLTVGTVFGEIVVAVLGTLLVTGEYSSGQIRSSLAAVPRRSRLFWAKATVAAVWSFLTGVIAILLALALAMPFLDVPAPSLTDPGFLGYIWGTGLAYAGIALMSLGLGFLLRSTAGSVTVMTVLLFVAPIAFQMASMWKPVFSKVTAVMPASVLQGVTDPLNAGESWKDFNPDSFLYHWQALACFGLWVAVPLVVGWVAFSRRDA